MTFYKAVEQKDANPELTPASDAKTDTTGVPATAAPAQAAPATTTDPATTLPTAGYLVQVAAVSKHEDADSLVRGADHDAAARGGAVLPTMRIAVSRMPAHLPRECRSSIYRRG